ncbi:MAG: hypothetical protein V3W41_04545 [Planctomycetota bacterium]
MNDAAPSRRWQQAPALGIIFATLVFATLAGCSPSSPQKVAKAPPTASAVETPVAKGSEDRENGMELMQATHAKKKFFVGLFHQDAETLDADLLESLREVAADPKHKAEFQAVDLTLSGQAPVIRKLDLARMPMPVVMVIAPSGAITKTILADEDGDFDLDELDTAFIGPAHAKVLEAFQAGKLVIVDMRALASYAHDPMENVTGIEALFADAEASANLARVNIGAEQAKGSDFFEQFRFGPDFDVALAQGTLIALPCPTALVLAPPGTELGRLTGKVTKDLLLAITAKYAAP